MSDRSETTYCLATNQPTNQPPTGTDLPEVYTSLRITIEHSKFDELHTNVLYDLTWYISYPHKGRNGDNEHYHIFFESGITERIRKRIKTHYGTGNKLFSFKSFQNGLGSAIQYGSKEGTLPYIVGAECDSWISSAPPWEHRNGAGVNAGINQRQLKNPDHFRQITYSNMEKVCLRFRKDNGMKTTDLADVLAAMLARDWRFQVTVLRNGIPSSMFDDFAARCEGDTVFCVGRVRRMKISERWTES